MFGQTNDLQQAIDQVNNPVAGAAGSTGSTDGSDNASGVDADVSAIQDQLGIPPMPPTDGAGMPPVPTDATSTAEAPAIEVPAAPAVEATPEVAPESTPAVEATPEITPENSEPAVAPEAPAGQALGDENDIAKIRENVLKDLMPLMDKVQTEPEKKFDIYKDAMSTLHDKGLVSGAYKVASQITNEDKKAESLMDLMQAIDSLK